MNTERLYVVCQWIGRTAGLLVGAAVVVPAFTLAGLTLAGGPVGIGVGLLLVGGIVRYWPLVLAALIIAVAAQVVRAVVDARRPEQRVMHKRRSARERFWDDVW